MTALLSQVPVIRGRLFLERLEIFDVVVGLAVEVNCKFKVALVTISIVPAKVFVPTLPATSVLVIVIM